MEELIEDRLRHWEGEYHCPSGLLNEAADEIERLRAALFKTESQGRLLQLEVDLMRPSIRRLQHQARVFEISVEAMAEMKAIVDGLSSQTPRDVVYGAIAEIEALPKEAPGSGDVFKATKRSEMAFPSVLRGAESAAAEMADEFIALGQTPMQAGSLVAHIYLQAAWMTAACGRLADGELPSADAFIAAARAATDRFDVSSLRESEGVAAEATVEWSTEDQS